MSNDDDEIEKSTPSRRPPGKTLEARENQLINKAVDLAEKQLEEGTATSQVIVHYLKLGSSREKLEQERLAAEIVLQQKKAEVMATAERIEELYETAIASMRSYAGLAPIETGEEVVDE